MLIVIAWWFISAHKWFKGPVINVEHHMFGTEAAVITGIEHSSDSDGPGVNKKAEIEACTSATTEVH
jgi:hypothetical protein